MLEKDERYAVAQAPAGQFALSGLAVVLAAWWASQTSREPAQERAAAVLPRLPSRAISTWANTA